MKTIVTALFLIIPCMCMAFDFPQADELTALENTMWNVEVVEPGTQTLYYHFCTGRCNDRTMHVMEDCAYSAIGNGVVLKKDNGDIVFIFGIGTMHGHQFEFDASGDQAEGTATGKWQDKIETRTAYFNRIYPSRDN